MLHLHDTATGTIRPFELRTPGEVSMYICGPTVYDLPHIGHGRFTLTFDVLRRYELFNGLAVRYVSNITDVDDNIIKRANAEGRTETEVAEEFEARWWEAMDLLGVLRPDDTPHATAYIDRMVALVSDLVGRGVAYEISDGVYLNVEQVPGYGLLARQPLESLQAGARVEAVEEKRSPLDFVLWKKAKPASRRGSRRGVRAGRVGTPSASSCRSTSSATASTSMAGDVIWPFPTTRTSAPRRWPRAGPSPATGCTTGGSRSTAPRCPSRWATSRPSRICCPGAMRGRTGSWCCGPTTARPSK